MRALESFSLKTWHRPPLWLPTPTPPGVALTHWDLQGCLVRAQGQGLRTGSTDDTKAAQWACDGTRQVASGRSSTDERRARPALPGWS